MPQQLLPTPSGLVMSSSNGNSNNYAGLRTPAAAASSLHLQQQPSMPQATDYLPSISPSVMFAHAALWTAQETHLLHQGLLEFPNDKYDNVTQYIKIAATIPGKSVRDVAFKVKTLSLAPPEKHLGGDSIQFAKRMKIEQYQEQMPKCISMMPVSGGGDLMEEAQLNALLQDNMFAINSMRANLLNGKPEANREPMVAFRDNCHTVLNAYVLSVGSF